MSPFLRFVVVMAALVVTVGMAVAFQGPASQPANPNGPSKGTIDTGSPKKSGDNTVSVSFKVGDKEQTHVLVAHTGEEGSSPEKRADDIKKGISPFEKAEIYVRTINDEAKKSHPEDPALHECVTASRIADLVIVVAKNGNKITAVRVTDNTDEEDVIKVYADAGDVVDSVGYVTFTGEVSGISTDDADDKAYVIVGVGSAVSVKILTKDHSIESLLREIVAELQAVGVSARFQQTVAGPEVKIFLGEEGLLIDSADKALTVHKAFALE